MARVLTIGGAGFVGRFTVRESLDRSDDVTLFTRGQTPIPFDESAVDHVRGDRRTDADLRAAAERVDPDIVVDFAAFHPEEVRAATEVFADADAYVIVSSTSANDRSAAFCAREGETPIQEYPDREGESEATYGERKAESDRVVAAAADRGVDAYSVRPTAMYGPYDPTEKLAALGWEQPAFETGVERAVAEYRGRDHDPDGPDRETEERLLAMLGEPRRVGSA